VHPSGAAALAVVSSGAGRCCGFAIGWPSNRAYRRHIARIVEEGGVWIVPAPPPACAPMPPNLAANVRLIVARAETSRTLLIQTEITQQNTNGQSTRIPLACDSRQQPCELWRWFSAIVAMLSEHRGFHHHPAACETLEVFPFVRGALQQLRDRGHRLGIISNAAKRCPKRRSGAEGWRSLGLLRRAAAGLQLRGKYHEGVSRLAASKAKLAPERCLFVGEDPDERGVAAGVGFRVASRLTAIDGPYTDRAPSHGGSRLSCRRNQKNPLPPSTPRSCDCLEPHQGSVDPAPKLEIT
jgi:hypothetical protein